MRVVAATLDKQYTATPPLTCAAPYSDDGARKHSHLSLSGNLDIDF